MGVNRAIVDIVVFMDPDSKIYESIPINSNQATTIDRKQSPVVPLDTIPIHKRQGATWWFILTPASTSAAGLFIIGHFVPPRSAKDSASKAELQESRSTLLLNTHFDCLLNSPNLHLFSIIRKVCSAT